MSQESTTLEPVEGIVIEVASSKSYERMPDEPTVWFRRFQRFLLQNGTRSALAVYKAERAECGATQSGSEGARAAQTVPGSWQEAMKRWQWNQRVSAYDLENLEREKKSVEADRAKRRQAVLDQEWEDSQLMLSTARESLKHGNKFFERTVRLQPGKFTESREIDPKTGREIIVRTKVDREVVYIEHKVEALNRMLMDGAKKARAAVNMMDAKSTEEFVNRQTGEVMDVEAVDREIYEMFELLGANNYRPPALPAAPEPDDLPPGVLDVDGPPDAIWPGGQE